MAQPVGATASSSGSPDYTPLPGLARKYFGLFHWEYQRLYLGPDHLFVVTTSRYVETYKRFYFADIQGLYVQKSIAGALLGLVFLLFAALFAAFGLVGWLQFGWSNLTAIIFGTIAMGWVVALLINTILGPTCDVQILTAVHEEPLTCLNRLYTAQRTIEILRGAIESVQGRAAISEDSLEEAAVRLNRAAQWHARRRQPVREEAIWPYVLFLALTVLDGILTVISFWYRGPLFDWIGLLLFLLMATLALVLLIRQRHSDVPQGLRGLIAINLIAIGVLVVALFTIMVAVTIALEPTEGFDPAMQRGEDMVYGVLIPFNLALDLLVVLIGSTLLVGWQRRRLRRAAMESVGLQQGGGAT